jgi:hypothetical protein
VNKLAHRSINCTNQSAEKISYLFFFKFLQYAFSNEDGTHFAEIEEPTDELINDSTDKAMLNKFKYGNRQQVFILKVQP